MTSYPVVIIRAGLAGYEVLKHGVQSIVLEQADKVGGVSRTETYKGDRLDIGGHRFFTRLFRVQGDKPS
jgi:protoporphyrinogen oxidase